MKNQFRKYLFSLLIFIITFKSFSQVTDTIPKNSRKAMTITFPEQEIYKYVNDYLPKFILTGLDGSKIDSEFLKGKPTVINLWFTNCAPCVEEIPVLNEIKSEYSDVVNFVAITFQEPNVVKSFLKLTEFDFFHLVNSKAYLETFGFFGYPKTIILDQDLKVMKIEKGFATYQNTKVENEIEFKRRILTHLNELLLTSRN